MSTTDVTALRGFAEALERAPLAALEAATIALNEAAHKAREDGINQIASELNLTRDYIGKHLQVKDSRRTDLVARIRAERRSVLATRYGAAQAMEPTVSVGRNALKLKGDPYRSIPKGQKAAGSIPWSVKRGATGPAWRNVFFAHLKTSGAWGMIRRKGPATKGMGVAADWKQNLEVVHSPSVSQAWGNVLNDVTPAAMALAQERFLEELARRL